MILEEVVVVVEGEAPEVVPMVRVHLTATDQRRTILQIHHREARPLYDHLIQQRLHLHQTDARWLHRQHLVLC